ncbi:hypothetical protein BKA65DRAFT_31956 [Rhexocercosporidium sp. MPI-PUGE-AT-0058]|nr:hypothetical protein BKA65DRAFT_31956 [Rhexocercosporidium sp. MPI-PUGE-AT-0058]
MSLESWFSDTCPPVVQKYRLCSPATRLKMAPPITITLIAMEASLVLTTLALFSYGYPSAARDALWEEGGIHHFNSNPKLRIYFYANHLEPPVIPYIWSQSFSDFNLGVAILTLWVFITRCLLRGLKVVNKWTDFFLHCCVMTFWIICLCGQQSPDYSDPEHPSRVPWYLTHSCGVADINTQPPCRIAQASFGMTIVAVLFYVGCVWKTVAYEGFDYLLEKFQSDTVEKSPAVVSRAMEEIRHEYGDSEEEGLLLRVWDDM